MRRHLLRWIVAAAVVGVVLLSSILFQLREGEVAVVTRLGAPRAVLRDAGLHLKWPWPIERAHPLDGRARLFNSRFAETLTRDKKNVILRTFVIWSVGDPLTFLQSMGDLETAEDRLDGLVTNAKNAVLGGYDLSALVSTEPGAIKIEEVEARILADVEATARQSYGIRVLQVGLKQLGLPADNVPQIFDRMRAEREKVAARHKAEGEREAARIRSETDLQAAKLRADGRREAARIRGEAEAEAARVYREAHSLNPEFYAFWRRLESLRELFNERTSLVLRTDQAPFDLLKMGGMRDEGSGMRGSGAKAKGAGDGNQ